MWGMAIRKLVSKTGKTGEGIIRGERKISKFHLIFFTYQGTSLKGIKSWNKLKEKREGMIMFVGKILAKTILLPLLLLVFLVRILYKIGLELSSVLVGGIILLVFGFLICALVQQTWEQVLLLFLTEGVLVLLTAGAGLLDSLLDIAMESLGDFMLS